jgi:tetratricopeptide (TPR) repeat protein
MSLFRAIFAAGLLIQGEVVLSTSLPLPKAMVDAWNQEVASTELEFNTKTWIRDLLDGKDVDAAHNWSSVDGVVPERLAPLTDATYLVLAVNNELYQASFNRLLDLLSRPAFVSSAAWKALEPELIKVYGDMLSTNAITLSKDQEVVLAKLPWSGIATDLKAFAAVRNGAMAEEAIKHVTVNRPWSYHLYMSAALNQARSGQLNVAIATLLGAYKNANDNPEAKNEMSLALGRLYYQTANLKAAEEWYSKADVKSPEAIIAGEELLWVWLRNGTTDRLRGTANNLNSSLFASHFMPEALVVKTISDLKLCQFDKAKIDYSEFLSTNREWAKRIDAAQKQDPTVAPPNVDWYAVYISRALSEREKELTRAKSLAGDSVAASVPAIGRQKHWDSVVQELTTHVSRLERQQAAEYRRQWRNNGVLLQEAIRKMQFVKIEMASQVETGAKAHPDSAQAATEAAKAVSSIEKAGETGWTFPADGEDWPDERLSMRSTGASVCL